MSIDYDDDNYDDDDVEQEQESPRGLRRAANKSKKLEAELSQLKRELAFAKAGIPMDDPKMNYFVKGYEGEMDPEAIRAAALEAGFLSSQQSGPDPVQAAVAESQNRVMSASAGAVYEDASEDAALARLEAAMAEGGMEAMLDVARQYGIPVAIDQ